MNRYYSASVIGQYVQESLSNPGRGKVLGVTSKGIFFLFGDKSIFLTEYPGKSPFNICLNDAKALYAEIGLGDEVEFSPSQIYLIAKEITISLANAQVWIVPAPAAILNSLANQAKAAKEMIKQLQLIDPNKGFLFLADASTETSSDRLQIKQHVDGIRRSFASADLPGCLEHCSYLFGLGGGLTPSGDDLVAGFLLYQRRLDLAKRAERAFVNDLGRQLTALAYQKTTWVSANRIEAAARGWSEALFLDAIDSLFDNSLEDPLGVATDLARFGHSSGVDTFMGISLAVGAI